SHMSGGNQQKVIIGRWLSTDVDVLIFDEPTKGVDVGARAEIYRLIEELARDGRGVIVISSDLPEVLGLSDRIIVMCEGRKTGEMERDQFSEELAMEYAIGGKQA
ncbi:MAG: sugar ABC transporter ATP-binding protein, partial [Lachnospiraceae bacterium]|nr:sugar ABC transporter ATP-binding protein [Lachnospiraceae bacterium]